MTDQGDGRYMLADAPHEEELARLRHLEEAYGPRTIRLLTELGIASGWKCLEVGAGAGGVARWLAERVGADGLVVATDINTRFIDEMDLPNLQVRRHDIAHDALEIERYDLVHCRMVLAHVRDTAGAVERMVKALRPGGVLLVEEPIRPPAQVDPSMPGAIEYERILSAVVAFLGKGGADASVGMRLPRLFARFGLSDIDGELTARVFRSPPRDQPLLGPAMKNIRQLLVTAGVVSDADIDLYLAIESDPDFSGMLYSTLGVWGRKHAT